MAEVAQKFNQEYPTDASKAGAAIERLSNGAVQASTRGKSEDDTQLLEAVNAIHEQMAENRPTPVSLCTLLPWQIVPQGPHYMHRSEFWPPACPMDAPYKQMLIREYIVDIAEARGGGHKVVKPILPIEIARDIHRQLQRQRMGGIFLYHGTHAPASREGKEKEAEKGAWDTAKRQMIVSFKKLNQDAEMDFHRPNKSGWANITSQHRLATQWLLHNGLLKREPEWMSIELNTDIEPNLCPNCKSQPGNGAFRCSECNFIIDPMGAFEFGEIDENHMALRRLTRQQLDMLGLDDVQTLAEAKASRLAKSKSAKAKKAKANEEPPKQA